MRAGPPTPSAPSAPLRRRPAIDRTRRLGRMLAATAMALWVAGCAATTEMGPASPTPADFPGIAQDLAAQGIRVEHVVSGDAGCDDRDLIPTAIGFTASGVDQPTPVPVHLFIFRDSDAYARLRAAVDRCSASFVTDPNGYESIDADPYVLVGQGPWGSRFVDALRTALHEAAGS